MEIKCVILDKEELIIEQITKYLAAFPAIKILQTFDDAFAGIEFLRNNKVDLLIMDANMPVVEALAQGMPVSEMPLFIFTIDYKQYIFEVLRWNSLNHLVKPTEFEYFAKVINKAIATYQAEKGVDDFLLVRSEYQLIKIDVDDIEYIESVENYLKINLTPEKSVMTLMTFKDLLEKLPGDKFIRIHRKYVIAIKKIKSLGKRKIKLNTVELPISNTYLDGIKELVRK